MAKAKPKDDETQRSGYSAKDMAEFVAALEGDGQETTTVSSSETDDELPEVAPELEHKIAVRSEDERRPAKRGRATVAKGSADIDHVLRQQPPEDMQRLTKKPRPGFRWGIFIGSLVVLAAASLAGFFYFNQAKKFTNDHVQLQFPAINGATSGGALTVTVEYQNLEPVDLTNVELTVEYPEGFAYQQSQPSTNKDFHNSFALGTIRSGQGGKVVITGTIVGAVGDVNQFAATLTYRPATFNSDFQQRALTEVKITSSILSLKLAGPTQLAPGAVGNWAITYTNTSDHDLASAQIAVTYPDGLTVTSTNPTAQERNSIWKVPAIKKGAEGKILITGTVNGNLGDTLNLKVSAGILSANNTVETQDEQSLLLVLIKTGVTTTVAVNGSTDPQVVEPGETLNYSVRVTNASDIEVTDATVTTQLEGGALNFETLTADNQATIAGGVLTWGKAQLAALANLQPSQSVTLTFSVQVASIIAVKTDQDEDQHVTATISVSSPDLTTNTNSGGATTTVVVTKIATIMKLTAEARYDDEQGVAVGSGPVPPTVGKTTSYRIIWTVTNTTSDAGTFVATARLPNSVLWTGQNLARDAGELTFDSDTRTVRWTLNVVPAGTGSRLPDLTAHFDVSVTPTAEQVGTVPVLVETSTAVATDSYSKKSLTSSSATLSTDVPTDAQAGGEGRVISGT